MKLDDVGEQSIPLLPPCVAPGERALVCLWIFWADGIDRTALEDSPFWHKEAQEMGETLSPLSTDFIQVFGMQINKNGINKQNPTEPMRSKI